VTQQSTTRTWRSVERFSIIAPLGIRFWDPAFDVPVDDGLTVTAYPDGARWPATNASRTPGGIYAFRGLPGLHHIEYPTGDPEGPGSLPAAGRFQIEVTDRASRFLLVCFFVDAPSNGVFPTGLTSSSSIAAPPGFYLFSAPARSVTPLVAVVRAQLSERLNQLNEQPAAYAVVEIDTPDGDTWIGLADDRGTVAVLFPYPTFARPSSPSLPAPASQQSWPITVRVRYQPSVLSFLNGSTLPDLRSVLAQASAAIWTQHVSPPGELLASLPATLIFGQELTLRSAQESVLLISLGSMP
jgi:hypothetical protein